MQVGAPTCSVGRLGLFGGPPDNSQNHNAHKEDNPLKHRPRNADYRPEAVRKRLVEQQVELDQNHEEGDESSADCFGSYHIQMKLTPRY